MAGIQFAPAPVCGLRQDLSLRVDFRQAAMPLRIFQNSPITGLEKVAVQARTFVRLKYHCWHGAITEAVGHTSRLGILLPTLADLPAQFCDIHQTRVQMSVRPFLRIPSS